MFKQITSHKHTHFPFSRNLGLEVSTKYDNANLAEYEQHDRDLTLTVFIPSF